VTGGFGPSDPQSGNKMANHADLSDPELHEPKGAASASAGQIYVSDGAGSGVWTPANSYNVNGWAYYKDNATAQTFTTTATKLSIDGLGTTTETSYLPLGVSNFWNTSTDEIIASGIGDSYIARLDLPISNATGSAAILEMELDIGGAASPTIVIVDRQISIVVGAGKTVSVSFGLFSLASFVANGGQIFLKTDANTADVTAPAILIQRISKGT
jgi:hypothetical protein